LKPEKSRNASLGIVFTPVRDIALRADYWAIKIDDYITTPSALAMVNAARAGGLLLFPVTFAPDGEVDTVIEKFANAGTADFRGWDIGASWRHNIPWGRLSFDYNGTYYTKADLVLGPGLVEHNVSTLVGNDGLPLALPINAGVLIRYKHVATLNFTHGPWSASVTQNYWSSYRTGNNQIDDAPHYIQPFETYDAQIEFSGIKNLKLAIGARNITDRNPPLYVPTSNQFQSGYDASLYDPRARFVYGRITYRFK